MLITCNDAGDNAETLYNGTFDWSKWAPVSGFITELRDRGLMNVDATTADPIYTQEKLAFGEAMFNYNNQAMITSAWELNPDADLSMMPVPAFHEDDEQIWLGGERECYGIWKDSPNKELAIALLEFMARPENVKYVCDMAGMPAGFVDIDSEQKLAEDYAQFADLQIYPYFDREWLPSGMWATMRTIGGALTAGEMSIEESCKAYLGGESVDDWDFAALRRHYMNWLCLPTDFQYTAEEKNNLQVEDIVKMLYDRGMSVLEAKEKKYGSKLMRELERICLLKNVDAKWMDHIDNMDQLKQGMSLRSYGQHDPIVEYRIEGFAMFDEMVASIREDAVHMLLTIEVRQPNVAPKREQVAKPTGEGAPTKAGAKGSAPIRVTKIGRNDPCPCGSGLKWKKCTCKEYHPDL